jgi:hypothetical protein
MLVAGQFAVGDFGINSRPRFQDGVLAVAGEPCASEKPKAYKERQRTDYLQN